MYVLSYIKFHSYKPYHVHMSVLILSYDFSKFIVLPKQVYPHRRNTIFICVEGTVHTNNIVYLHRKNLIFYLLLTFSHTKYPQFGK